jgi:hypothetical protein
VRIKRVQPEIPEGLRTVPPLPDPPVGDDVTQRDVASYLLDVGEQYEACRDTHRTLVDLIDPEKEK